MGLLLNKIFDPRDALDKAHRKEMERYAKAHGINEIRPGMPAVVMRKILRRKGVKDIGVKRVLGQQGPSGFEAEAERIVDADDLLMEEWEGNSYKGMNMGTIRRICKEKGIPQKRTDNADILIAKLVEHGKNAS